MPQDLAQILAHERDRIVSTFVGEIQRTQLAPAGILRSLLIDHIPRFLDDIVDELRQQRDVRNTLEVVGTSPTAREHGGQRWGLGYDLEAVIREYGILRHCILQTAKDAELALTIDEFDVLAKCLSIGVAEAASAYIHFRDEQLNAQKANLEFLAEAGQLLSSSLDYRSTLTRLTSLIVPRLADCCVVHLDGHDLDDTPIAHVDPNKIELARAIFQRFPIPDDSRFGYKHVTRTGEPQLVRDVPPGWVETSAQGPEHLALLRQMNVCSWLIVPLKIQGNLIGALSLTYNDSKRHYGDEDLVLASELARRAAVAIDNARLYDMSQNERSRVEAATRAKDEFVAMVSHELRTPLNAILGWMRLLRGGSLPESKREHALDVIERNANAQNQLVADLLDISRVITGKVRINPSQVDLSNIVDMVIEGVRPAAEAKKIQITADLDRTASLMRGDGERLQQVVWNLLGNAVKFTPKRGEVRVRLRRVESDLELTVQDNGEGIPESFLPHVFDSFRQSDGSTSRKYGGLGIGLSIVKHLVELHGGVIGVESAGPGQGATFLARLPISPLVSTTLGISRIPATKQETYGAPIPEETNDIRVLVVDDEPDARELVAYVLDRSGMEVRIASSAAEALKELESFTPHVIVSDVGMPEEDGYSLIRSIRTLASAEKKNIPAIALTAFARNEDRTRALVEGFNLHMAKPVEPSALVHAVVDLAGHVRR